MKILCFVILLLNLNCSAWAESWQNLSSIQEAIQAFVESNNPIAGQSRIEIKPLDSHLQLPECQQNLEITSYTGELKPGNNTLLVQCIGQQSWKIYSSINLKVLKDVVLLNKSLKKGEIIKANDINLASRELSSISPGYLTDTIEVIDKQATRNLTAGTVLTKQSFQELTLVKRGEQVHIRSGNNSFSISMVGIAMTNGAKGEMIRIKNLSSQKFIQALVLDAGQVTVNF